MKKSSISQITNQVELQQNQSTLLFKGFKLILILIITTLPVIYSPAQVIKPLFFYTLSIPNPTTHIYHIELHTSGWSKDTVQFKMPRWMPGYYQIMDYSNDVNNIFAKNDQGRDIPLKRINKNTWEITGIKSKSFDLVYDIKTSRQFVANSYIDSNHAYLIPANTFLYVDGFLDTPVSVKIINNPSWNKIATGLEMVKGKTNEFTASDFDILYDCPILIGNLEELSSFKVNGIEHRFIGYNIGTFDRTNFINKLKLIVKSAVDIIGDIPYNQYTFIAIGPGRGGIEHLNNTTISFDGSQLNSEEEMNKMMNFLAHEYFHHFNVKRIRPFEVGPFDYDKGSKTNLLWVSEGLSVYYEYLIVKRAGLINNRIFFEDFERNINTVENNPGRLYQSLTQASYNTWKDGPFGKQGEERGKSISYYEKGPIIGLLLDFAIRNATQNEKTLDNVMQYLYWEYYKKKQRGFTDAEFQQTCEIIAGVSLTSLFEYVYTAKEIDYNTYLNFGGLKLDLKLNDTDSAKQKKKYTLNRISNPNSLQLTILNSWLGEQY